MLAAHATELAELGFSVLPIVEFEKRPAVDWKVYTTRRAEIGEIETWWKENHKYGVGIVTGNISGNVVLDIDPTPPHSADELIADAEVHFQKRLPSTCRVQTCGGGYHDHYRTTVPVKTKYIYKSPKGSIQIRGEDSIVVMPPTSAFSKRTNAIADYKYIRGIPDRVLWQDTWLNYIGTSIDTTSVEVAFTNQEECNHVLKKYWGKLNKTAQQYILGAKTSGDRSDDSFYVACEAVRSGVSDIREIAAITASCLWHKSKYGNRPAESEWGAWGHAVKCAQKALNEVLPTMQAVKTKYTIIPLNTVPPEEPQFLLYPYLPKGEITLLDGDPGDGKSLCWQALCAGLTGSTSLQLPTKAEKAKHRILILTTEDDLSYNLSNRLNKMGADTSCIAVLAPPTYETFHDVSGITYSEFEGATEQIREYCPDLMIIDPISLFVSETDIDIDKATQVRSMMKAIMRLTRELNCATIIVRHLRKQSATKAIYRGSGSIDLMASARSALAVTRDDDGNKCLMHIKSNLAKPGQTLMFTLSDNPQQPFVWDGYSTCTGLGELLGDKRGENTERGGSIDTKLAEEYLIKLFEDGPIPMVEANRLMSEGNFAITVLNEAKKNLLITNRNIGGEWITEMRG